MTESMLGASNLGADLQAALLMSQQATAIAAQMQELTGVARSANDAVEVTVDHHGFVTGIRFGHGATSNGVDKLGAQVLAATSRAIADLQEKARPIRAQLTVDPAEILARNERRDDLNESALSRLESNINRGDVG
jgi:DNA-binding protein YbaB